MSSVVITIATAWKIITKISSRREAPGAPRLSSATIRVRSRFGTLLALPLTLVSRPSRPSRKSRSSVQFLKLCSRCILNAPATTSKKKGSCSRLSRDRRQLRSTVKTSLHSRSSPKALLRMASRFYRSAAVPSMACAPSHLATSRCSQVRSRTLTMA